LFNAGSSFLHLQKSFLVFDSIELFQFLCVFSGRVVVKYSTPQAAAYAHDKMDGMEYLPGHRISVYYVKDLPAR
jgi:hypothetical protein